MTLSLSNHESNVNTRGTIRRIRKHGTEYDPILHHYIDGQPAPFGLLCKSRKTGKYVWFASKKVFEYHDAPEGTLHPLPQMIEGVKSVTPNKEMLYEYLDYLMTIVLSKRDQKKHEILYGRIKVNQKSLFEILGTT